MLDLLATLTPLAITDELLGWLRFSWYLLLVLVGFSLIIFVHELGHFLAAKWMGIRVDRFAVGFFHRVCGYRAGEGFTFGRRPEYSAAELQEKGYGETDYCINVLPFGGYVKMLGQDDIIINEETGEVRTSDDPRSYTNKPVEKRMVVISAGVVFNLLFAVLAYAFVFLFLGQSVYAARIGYVEPESPGAQAGLRAGDEIVQIDGRRVENFNDVIMGWLLADETMKVRVERAGRVLDDEIVVHLPIADGEKPRIGITPVSRAVILPGSGVSRQPSVLPAGATVMAVNGQPAEQGLEVASAFLTSRGHPVELTVEWNDDHDQVQTMSAPVTPIMRLVSTQPDAADEFQVADGRHLLGLRRRQFVHGVVRGSPAEVAGFQPGDAVVQWGNTPNPLYSDIVRSIYAHEDEAIPVVVDRAGATVTLEVIPRRKASLFEQNPPQVGIEFMEEDARAVVADIAPDTPAAALGMPRGAEILAVGDAPVRTWPDVLEALQRAAGSAVAVRYRTAGDEVVAHLNVPSSFVNELNLPPTAVIISIDGETEVKLPSGQVVGIDDTRGAHELLRRRVGETVTIRYIAGLADTTLSEARFTVREDNTDPWQKRVLYACPIVTERQERTWLTAGGNPIRALGMGIAATGDVLVQVYRFLKSMVEGTVTQRKGGVSPKNFAGPVGIFGIAFQQADSGYGDLLAFLALISVNLAVFNFLPLPVVDGGLMVFLILEKIRGKPLSIKVQVTTTLIGLAVIVGVFLFVTLQDISRLWTG